MKNFAIFSFLATMVNIAVAVTADPAFFQEVNSWVNASGIAQSTTPVDFTPAGSHGLEVVAPALVTDAQVYALNATTGTEDPTGNVLVNGTGDLFINCTVATNAAGEENYIWASWNATGASYEAFGDAKAAFASYPASTNATTTPATGTGSGSKRKRQATTEATTPATAATVTQPVYTDSASVADPDAIIYPACPSAPANSTVTAPATNVTVAATTPATGTGSGSGSRRRELFGRSRFD